MVRWLIRNKGSAMSFENQYSTALTSSNLRDDEHHRQTEVLAAAALADLRGGGLVFGSYLARARLADAVPRKTFEGGCQNLAVLLRVWTAAVTQKGADRGWLKIKHAWDITAARAMYAKIARVSLAHWLGGECEVCNGTRIANSRACTHCDGDGREPVKGGALEVKYTKDMISELEDLYQSHSARAGAKMRRAA